MGPKADKKKKAKKEEVKVEESGKLCRYDRWYDDVAYLHILIEYDSMDLEMLREVVPMLRQQLEKSMMDRNYVQLEKVNWFQMPYL